MMRWWFDRRFRWLSGRQQKSFFFDGKKENEKWRIFSSRRRCEEAHSMEVVAREGIQIFHSIFLFTYMPFYGHTTSYKHKYAMWWWCEFNSLFWFLQTDYLPLKNSRVSLRASLFLQCVATSRSLLLRRLPSCLLFPFLCLFRFLGFLLSLLRWTELVTGRKVWLDLPS